MDTSSILRILDAEIDRLQQARDILAGGATQASPHRSATARPRSLAIVKPKRTMSPEARLRIAEAMKARWAAKRSSKTAAKAAKKPAKSPSKSPAKKP